METLGLWFAALAILALATVWAVFVAIVLMPARLYTRLAARIQTKRRTRRRPTGSAR